MSWIVTALPIFEWIGTGTNIAATFSQTGKTLLTKKVDTLAFKTFLINFIGGFLWFINNILARTLGGMLSGMFPLLALIILFYFFARHNNWTRFKAMTLMFSLAGAILIIFVFGLLQFFVWKTPVAYWITLVIGLVAATNSMASFVPQFLKMLKTKRSEDLSLMLIAFSAFSQLIWTLFWGLRLGAQAEGVVDGNGNLLEYNIGEWLPGLLAASWCTVLFTAILIVQIYQMIINRNKEVANGKTRNA